MATAEPSFPAACLAWLWLLHGTVIPVFEPRRRTRRHLQSQCRCAGHNSVGGSVVSHTFFFALLATLFRRELLRPASAKTPFYRFWYSQNLPLKKLIRFLQAKQECAANAAASMKSHRIVEKRTYRQLDVSKTGCIFSCIRLS